MTASNHMQAVAEEAILDHFRTHDAGPFHSDDLWHVIPDEHRGVISLAVMALVNKKLITGCGYRKSAIPSRKRSPSQEYRLTELGRNRLAGVGGGNATGSISRPLASGHSPHSGENAGVGAGNGQQAGGSESHSSACASSDPGEGSSGVAHENASVAPGGPRPEPEPLSLLPEPDPEAWAA